MNRATAVAHPNIALSKYWGKRARPGNFPAVPSLSITLAGMTTTTRVAFDRAEGPDVVTIDGAPARPDDLARVTAVLERVRSAARTEERATVESASDFPAGSGLASSASGFAALALAATSAAGLDWSEERVSDLARRGSASAARSIFGGFVELSAGAEQGSEEDVLGARALADKGALDVRVLVCVATEARKKSSSRDAMLHTMNESPYYGAWLALAPDLHEQMKQALGARDVERLLSLAERSSLAMHASAMGAGIVYLNDTSHAVMARVRELRGGGACAYATSDAGPHVKVLTTGADEARVRAALEGTPGVLRIIACAAGEGAKLA
jgi:diphosphomevalonate decarboxylase